VLERKETDMLLLATTRNGSPIACRLGGKDICPVVMARAVAVAVLVSARKAGRAAKAGRHMWIVNK